MLYLAWVQLPMATSATNVISDLNRDRTVRDVLHSDAEICADDAETDTWTVYSQEFFGADTCFRVFIEGSHQIMSAEELAKLRGEQERRGKYAVFLDGPENCYWIHRNRYRSLGRDELILVCYLAKTGQGFRCKKEMVEQGFRITNPSETFKRCRKKLEGAVEPAPSGKASRNMGWDVSGPTCCILPHNAP
jgi:hypothetical protein